MRIIPCFSYTFGRRMEEPAPAVQARCFLPRLMKIFPVVFMVDTGAEGTCLHGYEAWIVQQQMRPSTLMLAEGIGGECYYYGERATLLFYDAKGDPVARTLRRLDIQQITPTNVSITISLLGRDILNRWTLHYDYSRDSIYLMVP